jgi:hypothetical protein
MISGCGPISRGSGTPLVTGSLHRSNYEDEDGGSYHCDLVVDFVGLANDALDVVVLSGDFSIHSKRKVLETASGAVKSVEIGVDLFFHAFIIGVSEEEC